MDIQMNWTPTRHYDWSKWNQVKYWFFYFRKFEYIKGITIRIFGIYWKIMESGATLKLISKR